MVDKANFSAHSGDFIGENNEVINIANVLGAKSGQGIVDYINDTTVHVPSGGKAYWGMIETLEDTAFEDLLQSNAYINGVAAPDIAGVFGSVAASQTLTLIGVATDAETLTIGTEVYELAADEDQVVTEGNIAVDITPYISNPSGTLTISDVVIDGETVTIGDDVYEFCADAAQSLTAGSTIAVDITSYATASQGTLTVAVNPTAGNTMTIGTTAYTFRATADFNAAGEIEIGTDAAATQVNIVEAIMGTDGVNTAHALVTIADFETNAAVITAKIGGVAGDLIATTSTFTSGSNLFDAVTLGTTTAGVDCTRGNAGSALARAINLSDTQGVGGNSAAGSGATLVILTADEKFPGEIATTETMANGSFGAATLVADTNCTAANAETAIAAAINGNANSAYTAVGGAGTTVVVTAKLKGTAANTTSTTETMANGSWGADTLAGGLNGTVSAQTRLYVL